MDPGLHKRFLEYRDRYVYFGKETGRPSLTVEEFTAADAEQRELDGKGDSRDDEEQVRFAELSRILFRD